MSAKDLFTVNEAAEKIGLTPDGVKKAIYTNRLKAEKLADMWIIRSSSLKKFLARRGIPSS